MRIGLLYSAAFGLLFATPAAAQQAEVLHFESTPALSVSASGPLPDSTKSDLGQNMADDFRMLGDRAGTPSANLSRSAIVAPIWMRSGIASAPAFPTAGAMLPATGEPCQTLPYKPRGDLDLRAEIRRSRLFPLMAQVACEEGVSTRLFDALVAQESRYKPYALSPKGAIGLTQLMPDTAAGLGISRPWDVTNNLRGGARYLRHNLDTFGRLDLALAAYNAGPSRVRKKWAVPAIAETRKYVASILRVVSGGRWPVPARRGAFSRPTARPVPTAQVVSYAANSNSGAR